MHDAEMKRLLWMRTHVPRRHHLSLAWPSVLWVKTVDVAYIRPLSELATWKASCPVRQNYLCSGCTVYVELLLVLIP